MSTAVQAAKTKVNQSATAPTRRQTNAMAAISTANGPRPIAAPNAGPAPPLPGHIGTRHHLIRWQKKI